MSKSTAAGTARALYSTWRSLELAGAADIAFGVDARRAFVLAGIAAVAHRVDSRSVLEFAGLADAAGSRCLRGLVLAGLTLLTHICVGTNCL